jgi:hypothetical protein
MSTSGNGTFSAPYTVITATDRSGQLLIVNAVTLTVSLFSAAARIYISSRVSRNVFSFYKDDFLCFTALVRAHHAVRFQSADRRQALLHHSICLDMDRRGSRERQIHRLDLPATSCSGSESMQLQLMRLKRCMLTSNSDAVCCRHIIPCDPLLQQTEHHISS